MSKHAFAHHHAGMAGHGPGRHFAAEVKHLLLHGAAEELHPAKLDFWHPQLPEIRVNHPEICGSPDQAGAPIRRWWGRALQVSTLILALAIPASAQEPCKVNVTTCKAAECSYLPGIGPSKGAAIEAAHPADEEALDAVAGIGEATLAKIRPFVTYAGETTCTSKQVAPKPVKDGAK